MGTGRLTRKIRVASVSGIASGFATTFFFFPPVAFAFASTLADDANALAAFIDPSALLPPLTAALIPLTPVTPIIVYTYVSIAS
jgi:hypothetical protein